MAGSALLCLAVLGAFGGPGPARPILLAHRGLAAAAPENTLCALRAAWSRGFSVEIDVRASRDGVPVLLHDPTLDRTTDGTGPVAARTLAELRRLDAGRWFSERFAGARIPTLEEALAAAASEAPPGSFVALDLKTPDPGFDERVARIVERTGMRERVFVFGVGAASARRFARAAPGLRVAAVALAPVMLDAWLRHASETPYRDVWTLFAPTANQVAAVRARGGRVWTWDRARPAGRSWWSMVAAVREAGVDGLCTDHPQAVAARWRRPAEGDGPSRRFSLPNGLRVVLTPAHRTGRVAVALLLGIGERHDPRGRSGMAHLLEHLLVTCGVGERRPRTAREFFAAHPLGANAQTGEDYTLVEVVVRPERLADALGDLAACLGELEIDAPDLERELPRLERELANMFGGIAALGARNLAREIALPSPAGARRGGVVKQLRAATLTELRERHRRLYRAGNAILSLAGDFEFQAARASIEERFGALDRGEPPPAPRPRAPRPGSFFTQIERPATAGERPRLHLALAVPAPPLPAPESGAFLVLAARLRITAPRIAHELDPELRARVSWAPLDDPTALFVQAATSPSGGRRPESLAERLRLALLEAAPPDRDELQAARAHARLVYGRLFGLGGTLGDPYAVALREAQRLHTGWSPRALERALNATTVAEVKRLAKRVLARSRCAAAAVLVP